VKVSESVIVKNVLFNHYSKIVIDTKYKIMPPTSRRRGVANTETTYMKKNII